jgi:hypothetical protein
MAFMKGAVSSWLASSNKYKTNFFRTLEKNVAPTLCPQEFGVLF